MFAEMKSSITFVSTNSNKNKKDMKVHLAKENGKETLCGGRISSSKVSGGGSNGYQRKQYFDVSVNYFTTCSTKERCVKCDAAFQLQTAK
jgi:hypothetical protein